MEPVAALAAARREAAENPDSLAAHLTLGRSCDEIGDAWGAIVAYETAGRLAPQDGEVLRRLSGAYRRGRRVREALAMADVAAQRDPQSAQTYLCLGDALLANEFGDAADRMYCRALAIDPQLALAECGRGAVQLAGAHWHEARAAFERALALAPDCAEARYNRALIDIRFGDYAAGNAGFSAIMDTAEQRPRFYYYHAGVPLWDGTPLGDRRLVVAYDQGIGNQIMMVRFLNDLRGFGAAISVETPPAMLALLQRNFPHLTFVSFTHWQPLDVMDVHVPIMQLPVTLNVVRESEIAKHVPYLTADPARIAALRNRLQLEPGLRHIGIVWHGNRDNARDRWRAAPLAAWSPLAGVPGIRFHSLQFGATSEERAQAPFPLLPAHEFIADMEDTAALVALMDVTVSVDTSVAHLAGALGYPVWMPDPLVSDYRWGTGGTDTPWYPSMRIFRQSVRDVWEPVFDAIATGLTKRGEPE